MKDKKDIDKYLILSYYIFSFYEQYIKKFGD